MTKILIVTGYYSLYVFLTKEGETAVHYAAEIKKEKLHREFEDIDLIKTVLDYDGDTNVHTKLVCIVQ